MSKIYYIISISCFNENEVYIMAISFDKNILIDMIKTNYKPYKDYNLEIRENLKIFQVLSSYNKEKLCDDYTVMYLSSSNINYDSGKFYAFNREKRIDNGLDYIIKNSLVDLSVFYDKINEISLFKDNLSANPILFDTYYEEGIMNA
jgi:hypothetical protein